MTQSTKWWKRYQSNFTRGMENWKKAKALFDEKDFKKALDYFTKHLKSDPYHAESIYYRALTYRSLEQYSRSLEEFEKLVNLTPNDASVFCERGISKFHLGDMKGALDDLDTAQEMEPENPFRYSSRAYIRAAVKDAEGAIQDYEKALELNPEDPISRNNLGLLEEQRGRMDAAKFNFDKADRLSGIKTNDERAEEFNKRNAIKEELASDIQPEKESLGKVFFGTLGRLFTDKTERKAFFDFLKKGGKK